MHCPTCKSKMTLLFTSAVCEVCNPPKNAAANIDTFVSRHNNRVVPYDVGPIIVHGNKYFERGEDHTKNEPAKEIPSSISERSPAIEMPGFWNNLAK